MKECAASGFRPLVNGTGVLVNNQQDDALRRSSSVPRPSPPGQQKRYTRSMTIAAGFVHGEGILICADSEFQVGGYKGIGNKVGAIEGSWGKIITAVWGNPDYAVDALQRLELELNRGFKTDLLTAVREILARAYSDLIFTRPDYAQSAQILYYGFVLGLYDDSTKQLRLCSTNDASLRELDSYYCGGFGRDAANAILGNLYSQEASKVDTAILAAYMLDQVKKEVPSCGGPSSFINLTSDGRIESDPIDASAVVHIENVGTFFRQQCALFATRHMYADDDDFEELCRQLMRSARHLRALWKDSQ